MFRHLDEGWPPRRGMSARSASGSSGARDDATIKQSAGMTLDDRDTAGKGAIPGKITQKLRRGAEAGGAARRRELSNGAAPAKADTSLVSLRE